MYVYSKIMLYKNEQILVYDGDLNKGFEAALKKSKKLVLSMAIAGAAFASTSAPKTTIWSFIRFVAWNSRFRLKIRDGCLSTNLSIHSQIKINKESGLVLPERDRYFSERANFGDKLIENLDKRYTIDVLSSGFLMNQTTLKAVFKKVYGKPIASYMKDYRMKKDAEILKESDMLLFDVASTVGRSS